MTIFPTDKVSDLPVNRNFIVLVDFNLNRLWQNDFYRTVKFEVE